MGYMMVIQWDLMGYMMVYPLVMTNIAIENGDLVRGIYPLIAWWIFP